MQEPVEWLEIKNYDATLPKTIWTKDKVRYDIQPLHTERFPAPIARQFLAQHPHWVRLPSNETGAPIRFPSERTVYIANITGSRVLPESVNVERHIDGEDRVVTIPNPLRTPTVVQHRLQGTQDLYGPDNDRKSRKHPSVNMTLEPLKRYALSWGDAETILSRDARAAEGHKGRVVRVDPPSSCEPNETWPLDDIRAYAHVVDPEFFDQAALTKKFPKAANYCPPGTSEPDSNALGKAKKELLNALFPCLVDSRYSKPPSQEVFETIKLEVLAKINEEAPRKGRR
jgi:hypothetical protein